MENESCEFCFYWQKCPACEIAGWCKKHSAFTEDDDICEFGIHYDTRHVFKTSYAKSSPF